MLKFHLCTLTIDRLYYCKFNPSQTLPLVYTAGVKDSVSLGPLLTFWCFIELSWLVPLYIATATGVIAIKTPEVSRRVFWHFIIEKLVSSKAVHSKVIHVPCASKVIHVPVM